MSSILTKIKSIYNTKELIRGAINSKGQYVGDDEPFRTYADKILEIESSGSSSSDYKLKTIDAKATGEEFVINATDKSCYGFSSVVVAGDENLVADNIREGVKVYGVKGAYRGENASTLASVITITPDGKDITRLPEGGYDGFKKVVVKGDKNLKDVYIKEGITIYGVTGTMRGGADAGCSIETTVKVYEKVEVNGSVIDGILRTTINIVQ